MVSTLRSNHITPPDEQTAWEWSTTLSAIGIPHRVDGHAGDWLITVPADRAAEARETIDKYETENRDWPPVTVPAPPAPRTTVMPWDALWGPGLMLLFYVWLGPYDSGDALLRAAASNSEQILAGEWWRVITALTLHSDFTHFAGNAVFLFIFAQAVCRIMDSGLGWFLILATGIAGNTAVACLADQLHVAVGDSTASFGAIGILSMHMAVENYRGTRIWRSLWSRTWIPICAGLALLGILGTSPGSDLLAHGLGFLFGLLFALPVAIFGSRWLPFWAQRLLELISLLLVFTAWAFVFTLTSQ